MSASAIQVGTSRPQLWHSSRRLWDADPQQQVAAPAASGLVEHFPHPLDQFSHKRLALTR